MLCCCNDTSSTDEAVFVKAQQLTSSQETAAALGLPQDTAADTKVFEEPAAPPKEEEVAPERAKAEVLDDSMTFDAQLIKRSAESALGWHLDVLDPRHLFICRLVKTGTTPIEIYNAGAPPGKQIQEGDYVLEVDGVSGNAEQLSDAIKKTDKVTVKIARPVLFTSTVDKTGGVLGLDLKYGPGGSSLLLEGIRKGIIEEQAPEVKPGDRIVAVSGREGPPHQLMESIQGGSVLDLRFSRVAAT